MYKTDGYLCPEGQGGYGRGNNDRNKERNGLLPTGLKGLISLYFRLLLFFWSGFYLTMWKALAFRGCRFPRPDPRLFAFEVWFQAVERHKLSAEWKSEHGVQLPRRMVIHHFQGLLRSYILTVSAFPLCSKHNLHPFCLLRGKEIEATKMFPEEWLIFTLQERSRIATSTNH